MKRTCIIKILWNIFLFSWTASKTGEKAIRLALSFGGSIAYNGSCAFRLCLKNR
jgi:hypothetical protein